MSAGEGIRIRNMFGWPADESVYYLDFGEGYRTWGTLTTASYMPSEGTAKDFPDSIYSSYLHEHSSQVERDQSD